MAAACCLSACEPPGGEALLRSPGLHGQALAIADAWRHACHAVLRCCRHCLAFFRSIAPQPS